MAKNAIDINKRGLALAQRNAELNQIENVHIYNSDVYEQVDKKKKFGLIITNPPIRAGKKVVNRILTGAADFLLPNGVLLVVIQKKQGEPSARKLLKQSYGNCTILRRDKGYYILQAIKQG